MLFVALKASLSFVGRGRYRVRTSNIKNIPHLRVGINRNANIYDDNKGTVNDMT